MSRRALAPVPQTIERGSIAFLYRPRVETSSVGGLDDIQRVIVLLSPERQPFERAIAIGRKRLPRSARRDRFWGFVDLVLTPGDMRVALDAKLYGTKTLGLRHLPAAKRFAAGHYELATHDGHTHLRWHIDRVATDDPVAHGSVVENDADYILTVANPDPAVWGLEETPDLQDELFDDLETHVTLPTPFPPALQQRFGDRRFLEVDSTEWLDHPGVELVLIGSGHESATQFGERRIRLR